MGTNHFSNPALPNLPAAVSGAVELAKVLTRQRSLGLYDDAQITALTDNAATRKNITFKLDELILRSTPKDTIVLYFAGHGVQYKERLYFPTFDTDFDLEGLPVAHTMLLWREIMNRVLTLTSPSKSKRVIVLIDTPYSGSAATEELTKFVLTANAPIRIFSSSGKNEAGVSGKPERRFQSVFAHYVTEGLTGKAAPPGKSSITLVDLVNYVKARVTEDSQGRQHPECPFVFDTDATTPIFAIPGAPSLPDSLRSENKPTCKFISPKVGQVVPGNKVPVVIEATDDAAVETVKLFVNGVPVPISVAPINADAPKAIRVTATKEMSKDIPATHTISRRFDSDVPLPLGEKEISLRAVVYDSSGNQGENSIIIQNTQVLPIRHDLYLLCVGVREYDEKSYNLMYADRDATEFEALMKKQERKQYADVHTIVLTNEKATVDAIRDALEWLQAAKPTDMVMVLLSGHGVQSEGQFYFASHNLMANNIKKTCVLGSDIVKMLGKVYAKKLLFIDACRSGGKLGPRQATSQQVSEATSEESGIVMLSSCSKGQSSYESDTLKQGLFTGGLLRAFQGEADQNKDGIVALSEIIFYVPYQVGAWRKQDQDQDPWIVLLEDFDPKTPLSIIK